MTDVVGARDEAGGLLLVIVGDGADVVVVDPASVDEGVEEVEEVAIDWERRMCFKWRSS